MFFLWKFSKHVKNRMNMDCMYSSPSCYTVSSQPIFLYLCFHPIRYLKQTQDTLSVPLSWLWNASDRDFMYKQHAIDTCNEINNNFWLLSNSQPIVRYLIASKNFYGWFVQIRILASFTQCIDFYNSLLLFSHPLVSDCLGPHGLQHVRPLCPSPSPRVCQVHIHCIGDAIQLLHRWCHPAISSSDTPFFFCPQSFPTSGT